MMSKKDTMTAATSEDNIDSHVVDIAADGNHNPWLNAILAAENEQRCHTKKLERPKIKVVGRMREAAKDYQKCMDPQVVSLGPLHRDKKELKDMESQKKIAANRFVSSSQMGIHVAYGKVREVAGKARQCYDARNINNDLSNDEAFTQLMFLDGCFIAYFIQKSNEGTIELEIGSRLFRRIFSDIFLLENQLPFVVLHALMKWRFGSSNRVELEIINFITSQTTLTNFYYSNRLPMWLLDFLRYERYFGLFGSGDDTEPLHLLDILQRMLLSSPIYRAADRDQKPGCCPAADSDDKAGYTPHQFGSVVELKEVGIRFGVSSSGHLTSVRFVGSLFFPKILLPTMVINDATISQMLNLIAFEMCFENHSNSGVTSFLCFMDSLINHAADVKELRAKGILHHALSSDDGVANFFNNLPLDTAADLQLFRNVKRRVWKHRASAMRVSTAVWLHTHCRNMWKALSFVAAVLLLLMTGVQTFFAVFPKKN